MDTRVVKLVNVVVMTIAFLLLGNVYCQPTPAADTGKLSIRRRERPRPISGFLGYAFAIIDLRGRLEVCELAANGA